MFNNWRLVKDVIVYLYNIVLGNLKIYRFLYVDINEKED